MSLEVLDVFDCCQICVWCKWPEVLHLYCRAPGQYESQQSKMWSGAETLSPTTSPTKVTARFVFWKLVWVFMFCDPALREMNRHTRETIILGLKPNIPSISWLHVWYSGYKYFGGRQTCPNIPRQVAFLFADPLSTAVVEKGLTSRGLSVEKARKLVNNERRMRWGGCGKNDEVFESDAENDDEKYFCGSREAF